MMVFLYDVKEYTALLHRRQSFSITSGRIL